MITSLYAGVLGLLLTFLSLDVIKARRANKISLGTGAANEIEAIVSAHANFAAYVPVLLILTYLAESSGRVSPWLLHPVALAFTIGRALHYQAFRGATMNFKLRVLGMQLTLWSLMLLSALNLYVFLAASLAAR